MKKSLKQLGIFDHDVFVSMSLWNYSALKVCWISNASHFPNVSFGAFKFFIMVLFANEFEI